MFDSSSINKTTGGKQNLFFQSDCSLLAAGLSIAAAGIWCSRREDAAGDRGTWMEENNEDSNSVQDSIN